MKAEALLLLVPVAAVALIAAIRRGRAGSSKSAPSSAPLGSPAIDIYRTAPEDIVPPSFVQVGSSLLSLPLAARTGGFARLSYRAALAAARANGAELLSHDEMIALADAARAAGLEIPYQELELPDAAQRAAGAVPGDRRMRSRAWCELEDGKIRAKLAERKWNGRAPYVAGKAWVRGAAPGRARLMGLRSAAGVWGQSGLNDPHDDDWTDYLTFTILRRPLAVA